MRIAYWKIESSTPDSGIIAEHPDHDQMDGMTVSSPGAYRVIVGVGVVPIRLDVRRDDGYTPVAMFNPGMARWYGTRLIEAAALWEAYEFGKLGHEPDPRWSEVQEWMRTNAADYLITETPDESIVPGVLRLLTEAKQVLASPPASTAMASHYPRDTAIGTMRHIARRVIDKQTTESAMALADARRDAIAAGHIRAEEFVPLVVEYFTPGQQAILRGKTGL